MQLHKKLITAFVVFVLVFFSRDLWAAGEITKKTQCMLCGGRILYGSLGEVLRNQNLKVKCYQKTRKIQSKLKRSNDPSKYPEMERFSALIPMVDQLKERSTEFNYMLERGFACRRLFKSQGKQKFQELRKANLILPVLPRKDFQSITGYEKGRIHAAYQEYLDYLMYADTSLLQQSGGMVYYQANYDSTQAAILSQIAQSPGLVTASSGATGLGATGGGRAPASETAAQEGEIEQKSYWVSPYPPEGVKASEYNYTHENLSPQNLAYTSIFHPKQICDYTKPRIKKVRNSVKKIAYANAATKEEGRFRHKELSRQFDRALETQSMKTCVERIKTLGALTQVFSNPAIAKDFYRQPKVLESKSRAYASNYGEALRVNLASLGSSYSGSPEIRQYRRRNYSNPRISSARPSRSVASVSATGGGRTVRTSSFAPAAQTSASPAVTTSSLKKRPPSGGGMPATANDLRGQSVYVETKCENLAWSEYALKVYNEKEGFTSTKLCHQKKTESDRTCIQEVEAEFISSCRNLVPEANTSMDRLVKDCRKEVAKVMEDATIGGPYLAQVFYDKNEDILNILSLHLTKFETGENCFQFSQYLKSLREPGSRKSLPRFFDKQEFLLFFNQDYFFNHQNEALMTLYTDLTDQNKVQDNASCVDVLYDSFDAIAAARKKLKFKVDDIQEEQLEVNDNEILVKIKDRNIQNKLAKYLSDYKKKYPSDAKVAAMGEVEFFNHHRLLLKDLDTYIHAVSCKTSSVSEIEDASGNK